MHCENNQEITDTVVMAYKIAENRDVMLPVSVCYDGNFLSFASEPVEIVDQEVVDEFLGEKNVNWHVALDPEKPMAVDPLTGLTPEGGVLFARYRKGQCQGMQNALPVIVDAHREWKERTGHEFAPLIEEYRLDGAEDAIMTIGSMTGAGKDAEARRVDIIVAGAAPVTMAQAAPATASDAKPAADKPAAAPAPTPNKGDVAWMLVCTALVIMMSIPALALFYGGMVRAKNMLSVLMQVFVTFSLITVLWCVYGYSLAFTEGARGPSPQA